MKPRILIPIIALSLLAIGCGASKPELNKEEQANMDKLFREGIKPDSGSTPGGATPAKDGTKPMNQDAG